MRRRWQPCICWPWSILTGIVGDLTLAQDSRGRGPDLGGCSASTLVAVLAVFLGPGGELLGLPVRRLYVTGLLAWGLVLHGLALSPRNWPGRTLLLSVYLAAAGAVAWLVPCGGLAAAPACASQSGWTPAWSPWFLAVRRCSDCSSSA